MGRRKWRKLFLAGLVAGSLLAGCGRDPGQEAESGNGKEKVTIAFWGDQLTEQYGKYLQESFPEVEFEFYAATNSTDFYRFKESMGDLPDILTVRRFSLRDVADWKDSLMDLSDTDLANTFHQSYLRSYTYSDGVVNWLPACAEVDSILVNKTLLDANEIPLPSNYEEFVDVCGRLQELGIRPMVTNFTADYACMEVLQGLSASLLMSYEGREWRQLYESGQTDQLDEEVWIPVLERMQEFIDYARIIEADTEEGFKVFDLYTAGQAAMVRGIGEEAERYGRDRTTVMMPYFGESEEDNWYLTYPAFQVAASARAEESKERKELILDVMETMLSEEGLRHISSSQNMIPYSKGVTIELSPAMAYLQPCIEKKHLYIRLASADMFSASREVVQGMIAGIYPDAHAAFAAFNQALQQVEEEKPTVAHIDTAYPYAFRPEGGSQAASAVLNTVRESLGTQFLIGQSIHVAGNVAAGDYTEEQLHYLTMGETPDILLCEMTGEQIYQYLEYVLSTPGRRGSVCNDSSLYVSCGFEMVIRKTEDSYVVEQLTVDGQDMDRGQVYSMAVLGNEELMLREALAAAGIMDYTRTTKAYKQIVVDWLAQEGRQLVAPTDYITLLQ